MNFNFSGNAQSVTSVPNHGGDVEWITEETITSEYDSFDFRVHAGDTFILRTGVLLFLNVNIGRGTNETSLYMNIPDGLEYDSVHCFDCYEISAMIDCLNTSDQTNKSLRCDIIGLQYENVIRFQVILKPLPMRNIISNYTFHMKVNTTGSDGTELSTEIVNCIQVVVDTDLTVNGKSIDDEIMFQASNYVPLGNAIHEDQIGPQVVHIYEIRNDGMATIEEVSVQIYGKYKIPGGISMLYLLEQPEMTKNMRRSAISMNVMCN